MSLRVLTVGNMYPPHHLGGYELVWQAAVRALRRAGHEVQVLTTDHRRPRAGPEADPGVARELRWYWRDHAFPALSPLARLRLERDNHRALARHLAEHRPHLVSWWAMGGLSLSLVERVRRSGVPALGWVNDDWLLYGPRVDQWLRSWRRVPWTRSVAGVPTRVDLERAAHWWFCSESVRSAARRAWPSLERTSVLHQGVGPEFRPAPARPWRGRLLYAGRLDPRKGVATLLDAVAAVEDVTLRVVGDGDPAEAARLRARAAAGAGRRVVFEPAVARARLAAVYADADAVVFPVEWAEPWGLVPLEAMAVGRPVLATGRGGSGEYLRDGENTLLYAAGDAAALAAAIRRLAHDAALRSRLREGGRATAARLTEERWLAAVVDAHEAAIR